VVRDTVFAVDDREVLEAFVEGGAKRAFGPTLHVEGDALLLDGWWHAAFRMAHDTFIVRDEETPDGSDALEQVRSALGARGLNMVGVNLPLIQAVTYTEIIVGDLSWELWATTLDAGTQAVAARASGESFLDNALDSQPSTADLSTELGGARRLAGLPATLIVTVGLTDTDTGLLAGALPECSWECRALGELTPEECSSLFPTIVVVDARSPAGLTFITGLRSNAWGRSVPLAALVQGDADQGSPDLVLDPAAGAQQWSERLRILLP